MPIQYFNHSQVTTNRVYFLLVVFTLLETLCGSYLVHYSNIITTTTFTYFISGLGLGILPMFNTGSGAFRNSKEHKTFARINSLILWSFFLFIVGFSIYHMAAIIKTTPIDYRYADMLPQIKAMCQRLFKGERIYAPIQKIWNGKSPPYLPLMWLPFAPAEYLGIDVRWTTITAILTGVFLTFHILTAPYRQQPLFIILPLISLFFLMNYLFLDEFPVMNALPSLKAHSLLGVSQEGLVIGFYLFLGFALSKRNPLLIGIAIGCCLLSRFSLFFWVPMYLIYVFFFESKNQAIVIATVIGLMLLSIFLIPFYFSQPEYFLNIPNDYTVGVERAWSSGQYLYLLGFAKFFDISQVRSLHNLQITLAVIIPAVIILLFIFLRKHIYLNPVFFGLCSLKISLTFFYAFLEVPYFYLYFVSTFFSYSIIFKYLAEFDITEPS